MTNTQKFAARELDILSKSCTKLNDRPVIEPFKEQILALCEAFGSSGQSGGSAPYVAGAICSALKHLLLQEPICPITGIEDEWVDVAEHNNGLPWYQNRRCGPIFKNGIDGQAYYLDAIVWKTQRRGAFTGSVEFADGQEIDSRQFIKDFPFTPKTFYIDVIEKEVAPEDWEYELKDPKQLEKVWKYYSRPDNL